MARYIKIFLNPLQGSVVLCCFYQRNRGRINSSQFAYFCKYNSTFAYFLQAVFI